MHVHNNPLLTLSSLIMENRPEGLSRKCCKVKGKTVESIKLFANSLPVKDSYIRSHIQYKETKYIHDQEPAANS